MAGLLTVGVFGGMSMFGGMSYPATFWAAGPARRSMSTAPRPPSRITMVTSTPTATPAASTAEPAERTSRAHTVSSAGGHAEAPRSSPSFAFASGVADRRWDRAYACR